MRFFNCGTGICSSDWENSVSSSVTYDTLEIVNFSYRGVDFSARNRTGNVFSNIYIYSQKYMVDTCFSMDTEESETSIHQLNVEHTHCRYGIRLRGVRAAAASSIHAENLFLESPRSAVMLIENSSVIIEALSVYYIGICQRDSRLIELGDAVYDIEHDWATYYPENTGYLKIGTLHVKGLNDPWFKHKNDWPHRGMNWPEGRDFLFFGRRQNARGVFRVQVDQYIWYTFHTDEELYHRLPCRGEIEFIRLGQLPVKGPTRERPVHRLCPFHTTYYDTDLKRMLMWTGDEWIGIS